MDTLIMLASVAGAIAVLLLGMFIAVKKFYIVASADEALVRTGGSEATVSVGGGLWVIPPFRQVARVSLQAITIPIERTGADAVPSQDRIPAEVKGVMLVQVDRSNHSAIHTAVQSLGVCSPRDMGRVVRDKVDDQVTDALRTAAFQRSFTAMNAEKQAFAEDVSHLLCDDLQKQGMVLLSVAVTHITQGPFVGDANDVLASEGRRNVTQVVQRNREETNQIIRDTEVKVGQQDISAKEATLNLELRGAQLEADQKRKISEYEAQQATASAKAVFIEEQAQAEAAAAKERAISEAEEREATQVEKAEITRQEQVALARSRADAATKAAAEAAAREMEEAEIARERAVQTAVIAKEKDLEEAAIAKERAVHVAAQQREQAIAEAAIIKERAIATAKADEAAARAEQARAEASQKEEEEAILTVSMRAAASRDKEVVLIKAEEEAGRSKIAADRDAYVLMKGAEGQRDAAVKKAEAMQAEARGRADAIRVEAEGYAADRAIKAKANFDASDLDAKSQIKLAEAALERGKAEAEARRLMVEAENSIGKELLIRDVAVKALEVAPDLAREIMAPVAKVAHDVKVLQINGLGGEGDGGSQSTPATIMGAGLALTGALPMVREFMESMKDNPDVRAMTGIVKGAAQEAVATVARGVRAEVTAAAAEAVKE